MMVFACRCVLATSFGLYLCRVRMRLSIADSLAS